MRPTLDHQCRFFRRRSHTSEIDLRASTGEDMSFDFAHPVEFRKWLFPINELPEDDAKAIAISCKRHCMAFQEFWRKPDGVLLIGSLGSGASVDYCQRPRESKIGNL